MLVLIALVLAAAPAPDDAVDRALARLRQGDLSAATELIRLGPPAVAAVTPLLADPSVDIRRQAVAVLAGVKGEESCRALATPLADANFEIRGRAALAFYHDCSRNRVPCARLMEGISKGDVSAAAILLCGSCPEAKPFLDNPPAERMKLEAYGPVVPASLVASLAKLRLGDRAQVPVIAAAVQSRALGETEFVLQALAELPDGDLVLLLPALDDTRDTRVLTAAPSGIRPRRICDAAADALAARLGLKLAAVNRGPAGRYTPQELRDAKSAIQAKLGKP